MLDSLITSCRRQVAEYPAKMFITEKYYQIIEQGVWTDTDYKKNYGAGL